jgi:putative salt-induced outer membrane protein YdiY
VPVARAAIVDALGAFEDGEPGWSGSMRGGFQASGGNSEQVDWVVGTRVQWSRDAHRVRLLADASRSSSASKRISEAELVHLRYNRRLRAPLYGLVFAQVQRNPLQRLRSRTLLGLGARVDLWDSQRLSVSVGAASMTEIEATQEQPDARTDQRLSSFFIGKWRLSDTASWSWSVYAQPRWADFADLRAIGSTSLAVQLTSHFGLEWGGQFAYDSRPPTDVEESDWSTSTALRYAF